MPGWDETLHQHMVCPASGRDGSVEGREEPGCSAGGPDLTSCFLQHCSCSWCSWRDRSQNSTGANENTVAFSICFPVAKRCREGHFSPLLSLQKYVFMQQIASGRKNVSELLQESGMIWAPLLHALALSGLLCSPNCSLTSFLAKDVRASCLSQSKILDKHSFSVFKPGCSHYQ